MIRLWFSLKKNSSFILLILFFAIIGLLYTNCGDTSTVSSNVQAKSSGSCKNIKLPLSQQPINPVSLLPTDNNGVILSVNALSGSNTATSTSGSLTFGINTQSNNTPGTGSTPSISASNILKADAYASFITTFNSTNYTGSFIDSGSNGLYFPGPNTLTECSSSSYAAGFYCPSSNTNYTATQKSYTGLQPTDFSFTIGNALALFNSLTSAGGNIDILGGVACDSSSPNYAYCDPEFDWGLPFFFGKSVYNGINSKSTGLVNGAYWASSTPINISSSASNVLAVTVGGCGYGGVNMPCVSITICKPGSTSECQTIPNILVDTGSFGLRIFSSKISVNLTQITDSNYGNSVAECAAFGSANTWGPLKTADIYLTGLSGEPKVTAPIQVINSNFSNYPSTCVSPETSPSSSGFNGILGVGVLTYDCGTACASIEQNETYYSCTN